MVMQERIKGTQPAWTPVIAPKGSHFYYEDDPATKLYRLRMGIVRVYRENPDARAVTLSVLRPGCLFGEEILDGGIYHTNASAFTNSVAEYLTRDQISDSIADDPLVLFESLNKHWSELVKCKFALENRRQAITIERLKSLLMMLSPYFANKYLDITQSELGELLNMERVNINVHLGELRQQGLVRTAGSRRGIQLIE